MEPQYPPNSNPYGIVDDTAELVEYSPTGTDDKDRDLMHLNMTAGYSAVLARLTSVAAAVLYNRICQMTRIHGCVDNGWVYYTAKAYEIDTAFTQHTFTKAYKQLVEAGLIEHSLTYIRLSRLKATHFRITGKSIQDLYLERTNAGFTTDKFVQDRDDKNVHSIYNERKKTNETLEMTKSVISGPSSNTYIDAPQPKAAPQASKGERQFVVKEKISVRPHARVGDPNKLPQAVAADLRKRLGFKGKMGVPFINAVKRWVEAGFKTEDILEAFELMDNINDEYWRNLSPLGRLSQNSLDWYQQQKHKPLWEQSTSSRPTSATQSMPTAFELFEMGMTAEEWQRRQEENDGQ